MNLQLQITRRVCTALVATLSVLPGCADPLPSPEVRAFGSFGEEAFRFLRGELSRSGTPTEGAARAMVFDDHRPEVVTALDHVASGPVKEGALPLLEAWLPLYEPAAVAAQASIPTLTRDLADILDLVAADGPLRDALAATSARSGMFPNALTALLGALARHPAAIVGDGLALAKALEPQLLELQRYLARELPALASAEPSDRAGQRLLARLFDLTVSPGPTPTGPPAWAVRLDDRGAPRLDPAWGGVMPQGFTDADADGRPDADARGRLVDAAGTPVAVQTFASRSSVDGVSHDAQGRAFSGTRFIYDYVDLRTSVAAFLLRDVRRLLARGGHHDLFAALEALAGPRVPAADADGAYQGRDPSRAPLLDLAHALNQLRTYPRLIPLVRTLEHLATSREDLLRGLVTEVARARAIVSGTPDVPGWLNFVVDATPVLDRLARHGTLRALAAEAGHPATNGLIPALTTLLTRSDLNLPFDTDVLARPADVDALTFSGAPAYAWPDTTDAERSWLHKAMLLIADTAEAPAFLVFLDLLDVPEVVITDDMANFYIAAIAGEARLDLGSAFLEDLTITTAPEFDDRDLSAEELNLFMNHDQTVFGNPRGRQGIPVRQLYGPALLALQASGGLDALRPWVTRVVRAGHGDDVVGLFQLLAGHWGETQYEVPGLRSRGTGLRVIEPTVARLLAETRLLPLLLELATWADAERFDAGGTELVVADELDAFLGWLVAPSADLRTRDGFDALRLETGAVIEDPSRLELLAHALDAVDRALDASPDARAAWERADLAGLFLDLAPDGSLLHANLLDVITAAIPAIADAIVEDASRPAFLGDVDAALPDLVSFMGSRGCAALLDLVARLREEPALRATADATLDALLAETPPPRADLLGGALRLAATAAHDDALHDALVPVLRFIGRVLEPSRDRVFNGIDSVFALRSLDSARVGDALIANLFDEPEIQAFPVLAIMDAFESALRPSPGAAAPLDAADLGHIAGQVRDFLRDPVTGMERVYRIILSRRLTARP